MHARSDHWKQWKHETSIAQAQKTDTSLLLGFAAINCAKVAGRRSILALENRHLAFGMLEAGLAQQVRPEVQRAVQRLDDLEHALV